MFCFRYILKPFDATELIARTVNLIEIRRALRARHQLNQRLEPSEINEPSADQVFLDRVSEIVEENIRDGGLTRLTPLGYFRMMRLKRAAQLLEKQAISQGCSVRHLEWRRASTLDPFLTTNIGTKLPSLYRNAILKNQRRDHKLAAQMIRLAS